MAEDHGPTIKNDKQYEALKDKGMSKQRAARIANDPGSSSKGGKASARASATPTPARAAPRRRRRRPVARAARAAAEPINRLGAKRRCDRFSDVYFGALATTT